MIVYAKVNRKIVIDRTLAKRILDVSTGKTEMTKELRRQLAQEFGGDGYIPGEYLMDIIHNLAQQGKKGTRLINYKDCTFEDVEFYDWTKN